MSYAAESWSSLLTSVSWKYCRWRGILSASTSHWRKLVLKKRDNYRMFSRVLARTNTKTQSWTTAFKPEMTHFSCFSEQTNSHFIISRCLTLCLSVSNALSGLVHTRAQYPHFYILPPGLLGRFTAYWDLSRAPSTLSCPLHIRVWYWPPDSHANRWIRGVPALIFSHWKHWVSVTREDTTYHSAIVSSFKTTFFI